METSSRPAAPSRPADRGRRAAARSWAMSPSQIIGKARTSHRRDRRTTSRTLGPGNGHLLRPVIEESPVCKIPLDHPPEDGKTAVKGRGDNAGDVRAAEQQ